MKKKLLHPFFFFCLFSSNAVTALTCIDLDGAYIIANDNQYLGFFGNNFASESIYNDFGTFGSQFSTLSVRNQFSSYGSQFNSLSATNEFTSTPPYILKYGEVIARLSANAFVAGAISLLEIDVNCSFSSTSPALSTQQNTSSEALPVQLSGLQASDGTSAKEVLLSWYPSLYATNYEVYVAETLNGDRTFLGNVASSLEAGFEDLLARQTAALLGQPVFRKTISTVITGGEPGKKYFYFVFPTNPLGSGGGQYDEGYLQKSVTTDNENNDKDDSSPLVPTISEVERNALLKFYSSTNGDSWTDDSGWGGTLGSECDWVGVTCSDGNVTELALFQNNLTGTIPEELGDLKSLSALRLQDNALTGNIPATIGKLTNLTIIVLSNNKMITGSIPKEIGNLKNLTSLALSSNNLSGSIPAELGNLTKLTNLGLASNSLTGSIPKELGKLVNLQFLSLRKNSLSGNIPTELGNLVNLSSLKLDDNLLTGTIPAELIKLVNLNVLNLDNNLLSGSVPAFLDAFNININAFAPFTESDEIPDIPQQSLSRITRTDGTATDSTISIGASSDSGETTNTTFTVDDEVTLTAKIYPDSGDVGEEGQLYVVMRSTIGGKKTFSALNEDGNWEAWNASLKSLPSAKIVASLQEVEDVLVYSGTITAGDRLFYVGYSLFTEDGKPVITTSLSPYKITVSE
jgi:hypothetical protein